MLTRSVSEAAERRRSLGRARAARWRERHAAEVASLQGLADAAPIDAAIVATLMRMHMARREATGDRDVALPLRPILLAVRDALVASGMAVSDADEAIRDRLRAGAVAATEGAGDVPGPGHALAA